MVTRVKDGVTLLPSAMAFGAAGQAGAHRERLAARPAPSWPRWASTWTSRRSPTRSARGGSAVIGSRSFGADPAANAAQVAAAVRGLQARRRRGRAQALPRPRAHHRDSHDELPVVALSRQDWDAEDRPPFAAGIEAGAGLVMSGHLDVQGLDKGVAGHLLRARS